MGVELDKDQREELRRMAAESDIKAAYVDRIIEMKSPEPPKRRFSIDIPKQKSGSDRLYLGVAVTGLATDAVVYFVRRKTTGGNGGLELVLGAIFLIACIVAVFLDIMNENTARVIGEELKIGQNSYFTCDIERIKCQNSEVKVISGGKPILKLTKSHEGCDELINLICRCLSVVVKAYHVVSGSSVQSRHDGSMLTEVPGKVDAEYIFLLTFICKLADLAPGVIG